MSVIWDKVWSDLWHHKVRTILAALSIAAGVFALGVIFGMINQLTPGLNRVHRQIVPGHITMVLNDNVDQDTIDRLARLDHVAGIEPMNERSIRYRLRPDEAWRPGVLIMRADYEAQTYNRLLLKAGDWPHHNQIGIDIRAADYLHLNWGDSVIFELDGSDRALPINGKIRHHFITSPDFGDVAHFFVDAQGLERFEIPAGEYNQLMIRVDPYSEELARTVASEIKDRLGKAGVSVAITFFNDPNEHWGQQFFDGIYLVLQLLAVVSLLMSVILIYNTLTALITQQTNQIGMMKAIGGSTTVIVRVYLAGVIVYGALALVVSLPVGMLAAFAMTRYFLDIFNVSYQTFQFSTQAVVIQAAAAIAVPLLAGLGPVLSGARITVREAIASYGLNGGSGPNRFDVWLERWGGRLLSAPNAMALSNMFRRKGRLGLTQLVLIAAGTLFLMVMTLTSSITLTIDNDLGRRGYQIRYTFNDNERIDRLIALTETATGVDEAEVWFVQPASLLQPGQRTREVGVGAQLIGIPIDSTMFRPRIVAGRWLEAGDDRAVVLNEETAAENGVEVSDTITLDLGDLGDDSWQVVGIYQVVSIRPAPDEIYAPQAAIYRTTTKHNVGRDLLIRTRFASPSYVETVDTQLAGLFESRWFHIADSQTIYKDRLFFDNFFAQYIPMLMAPAVILAIVGGIGLMGALSISVVERVREIGVMRAIGAKTPVILGMLLLEGSLQGFTSWLVAVPLSFILGQPLAAVMGQALFDIGLDYQYNLSAVLVWLVAVLTISTLASLLPARNATLISVRESLAYA